MLQKKEATDARIGVIVADGGRARILTANGRGVRKALIEIDYLERPNLHVAKRDMTSDLAAGVLRFAKAVARRIDSLLQHEPISDLILIIEPRFLGQLRPCLSKRTQARVSREISRDYVHANAARIQRTAFARRPNGER